MRVDRHWLGRAIRKPSQSDWGIGMTVCIATLCEMGRQVVSVSDHKLSMGQFSADGMALKNDLIHHNWSAMWANDVSYVPAILGCVAKQLKREEEYEWLEVATAFANAHAAILRSEINNCILANSGYTRESFYRTGKGTLTPSAFNALHRRITDLSLNADFLVYGFDANGDGHIFTFENGRTKSCDKAGMWAIGSGDYSALSTLFFAAKQYRFNQNKPLSEALYVALAAKFMAESAEGVGERTFLVVNQANHLSGFFRHDGFIEEYRKRWFDEHAPKWPQEEMEFLKAEFKPGQKMGK